MEEGKLEVSYRWFCTCKDAGEIERMYIRPKFRGEKLGNFLIEEVIDVSKGNGGEFYIRGVKLWRVV